MPFFGLRNKISQNQLMENINMLEYYLLRKAGNKFNLLELNKESEIERGFLNLEILQLKIKKCSTQICNYLFEEIKKEDVKRSFLLNLKRKVFNLKFLSDAEIMQTYDNLILNKYLINYNNYYLKINDVKVLISELENESKEEFSKKIQVEASSISFRKALMISSFSLYKNLTSQSTKTKRSKDIEYGLLKYLLRATSKTSPFSYFTTVELKRFNTNHKKPSKTSFIKVNANILKYILFKINNNTELKTILPLAINSTLDNYENGFIFLNFVNNESIINKIKESDLIKLIIEHSKNSKLVNYKSLENLILKNYEIDIVSIREIIFELFRVDFLVIDFSISMNYNWILNLKSKLEMFKKNSFLINQTILLLDCLNELELSFRSLNLIERENLLVKCFKNLINYCVVFHKPTNSDCLINDNVDIYKAYEFDNFKFRIENLIFEDVKEDSEEELEFDCVSNVCKDLNMINNTLTSAVKVQNKLEINLIKLFMDNFKSDEVSILKAYYEYRKKYKGNSLKPKLSIEKGLLKRFEVTAIKNELRVEINPYDLETEIIKFNNSETSYNAYLQIGTDRENSKKYIIVNGLYPGYGKMFSRFLYMQNQTTIDSFKKFNANQNKEVLCDNNENTFFNGNIHPMIVDTEILNYNRINNVGKDNFFKLSELILKLENNKLIVHDKNNNILKFVDLGFQISDLHSNFFRFLDNFSPNNKSNYSTLIKNLNVKHKKTRSSIKFFPRIVFNEILVLQRMFWVIKSNQLKFINNLQPNEVFLQINIWRRKLKIPSIVYVTFNYNKDLLTKFNNDLHKPFLVNFYNPQLLIYFLKQITQKVQSVKFTEMLPDYRQTNKKEVIEYLVQWKTN